MDRLLKNELHAYFSAIKNPTDTEKHLLLNVTHSLQNFSTGAIDRADLQHQGYDVSNVDDSVIDDLARKVGDNYREQLLWISLDIIADDLDIPKHMCLALSFSPHWSTERR